MPKIQVSEVQKVRCQTSFVFSQNSVYLIFIIPQKAGLISAEQAQEGVDRELLDSALACITEQLSEARTHKGQKPYVLMIDSQANLDAHVLRIINELASVRVADQVIMHCLVFHRVTKDAARSINAHHGANQSNNHYWLRRLTLVEINEYLQHHMMLFDFNRRDLFTHEMAYFTADRSEGVFRSINTLVRNAFTIANLEDSDRLSMSHLLKAGLPPRAEISTESGFLARHKGQVIALMGSCVVASVAAAVFMVR